MVAMFEVVTMSSNAVLVSGAQEIDVYSSVVIGAVERASRHGNGDGICYLDLDATAFRAA